MKQITPKIIHQVWVGNKPLPEEFKNYQQGLLKLHASNDPRMNKSAKGWEFYFWQDANIEQLLNAVGEKFSNIFSYNIKEYYERMNVIQRADFVRLLVVYVYGGTYIDMDVEGVKNIEPLLKHSAFVAMEDDLKYCNAVFGAEKESFFIGAQLMKIPQVIEKGTFGVGLMTEICQYFVSLNQKQITVLPTEFFYPYSWDEKDESKMVAAHETYLIHKWAKTWWEKK